MCTKSLEKGSLEENTAVFSDEDIIELAVNEGEDALTTFDAAMLVNVKGNIDGIQTELYDSGVSCHMLPYQDHFGNYTPIASKSITAANKWYFQAIGKGNLQIKISNGSSTTTILLKDVLHCLNMGLTLVSIGKITNTSYKVIFQGATCMIYNSKDKAIGQIHARNGLYWVDHEITINMAMAGKDWEILTIEELHWWMGHITPKTAKQMVSSEAIKGIKIDLTLEIKQCSSCKYAKATQKPIKKKCQTPRAAKFSDKIHSDEWGPSPIQTPGHKNYYVSFTDNHTRWTHIELLAMKDGILQAYKCFEAWDKLSIEIPTFKVLCSDHRREYLGTEFSKHLHSQGTAWQLTVHGTPEYNGVSEHLNQTLLEHMHTLLHSSKLPKNLWEEATNHIVWLKNRTITWALPDGKCPMKCCMIRSQIWKNCKNGEIKFGYIPLVVQNWMDAQRLEDGLLTTKLAMATEFIGLTNVL